LFRAILEKGIQKRNALPFILRLWRRYVCSVEAEFW